MVRAILGVVIGYLAMALVVGVFLTGAYAVLGADRAYRPGSWEISGLWVGGTLASGLVAALIGGVVCALIARRGSRAPLGLAGLIVVMSVVSIMMAKTPQDAGPRVGEPTTREAATNSVTPLWVQIVLPVVGVVGSLGGAALTGRGKRAAEPAHSSDQG